MLASGSGLVRLRLKIRGRLRPRLRGGVSSLVCWRSALPGRGLAYSLGLVYVKTDEAQHSASLGCVQRRAAPSLGRAAAWAALRLAGHTGRGFDRGRDHGFGQLPLLSLRPVLRRLGLERTGVDRPCRRLAKEPKRCQSHLAKVGVRVRLRRRHRVGRDEIEGLNRAPHTAACPAMLRRETRYSPLPVGC